MKSALFYTTVALIGFTLFSCYEEHNPLVEKDFRDPFVGIYDCIKGSDTIELEVKIDPENDGNIIIGPYSIPIAEDGSFGLAEIEQNIFIELRFYGNSIYYREQKEIINGLAFPCILEGIKRT